MFPESNIFNIYYFFLKVSFQQSFCESLTIFYGD